MMDLLLILLWAILGLGWPVQCLNGNGVVWVYPFGYESGITTSIEVIRGPVVEVDRSVSVVVLGTSHVLHIANIHIVRVDRFSVVVLGTGHDLRGASIHIVRVDRLRHI